MNATVTSERGRAYREGLRLLRDLARLAETGRSQTPAAATIRAALDEQWESMSEAEQSLLESLSADLWTLMDPRPLGPVPEAGHERALSEARSQSRWMEVAALLRDYPRLATGPQGALLRAEYWLALGEQEIAAEFICLASRTLPVRQLQPATVAARREELRRCSGITKPPPVAPFLSAAPL
jgi:hypothetical protein